MVDWASVGIAAGISAGLSVPAYLFAFLTWRESQKQSRLLTTITEALPLIVKKRKPRTPRKSQAPGVVQRIPPAVKPPAPPSRTAIIREQAAERARLRLQLQKEKQDWQRQKDMAKAIGWIIDRLGTSEDDEYDDEDE